MDAGPAFVRAVEANDPEAMKATSLALYDMARDLIALRHREPLDASTDPTSAILAARIDGEPCPMPWPSAWCVRCWWWASHRRRW